MCSPRSRCAAGTIATPVLARITWTNLSADDFLGDCRAVLVRKEFGMPWGGILAVGAGAAIGAWLRWGLGIMLNPVFPTLPLGTLSANLIGGLLLGKEYWWGTIAIASHVVGSLAMTILGILFIRAVYAWAAAA